jgi:hypothetical protein
MEYSIRTLKISSIEMSNLADWSDGISHVLIILYLMSQDEQSSRLERYGLSSFHPCTYNFIFDVSR